MVWEKVSLVGWWEGSVEDVPAAAQSPGVRQEIPDGYTDAASAWPSRKRRELILILENDMLTSP